MKQTTEKDRESKKKQEELKCPHTFNPKENYLLCFEFFILKSLKKIGNIYQIGKVY